MVSLLVISSRTCPRSSSGDQVATLPAGWVRDVATTIMGEDARSDTFADELGGAMAESGEKTVLPAIDQLLSEFDLDLASYDELWKTS